MERGRKDAFPASVSLNDVCCCSPHLLVPRVYRLSWLSDEITGTGRGKKRQVRTAKGAMRAAANKVKYSNGASLDVALEMRALTLQVCVIWCFLNPLAALPLVFQREKNPQKLSCCVISDCFFSSPVCLGFFSFLFLSRGRGKVSAFYVDLPPTS